MPYSWFWLASRTPARLLRRLTLAVLCTLGSAGAGLAQATPDGRRITVHDWLTREQVTDVSFAPDGRALAYTRTRPSSNPRQDYNLPGANGGDVWVQLAPGQPQRKITDGAVDGSSWWRPLWSPDGERLALRSTRGGQVTLWIWERATGALRQLMPEPVWGDDAQVQWIGPDRLLVHVRAAGDTLGDRYPVPASDGGRSASVLEAGITADGTEWAWAHGPLVLVEVLTGRRRIVTPWALKPFFFNYHAFGAQVSPQQRWVAVPRVAELAAPLGELPGGFYWDPWRLAVEVHALGAPAPRFAAPLPHGMKPGTLRWSRDGRELTYVSVDPARAGSPQLVILQPSQGSVQTVDLDSLGSSQRHEYTRVELAWTVQGDVVLETQPFKPGYYHEPTEAMHWLVSRRGVMRRVSPEERLKVVVPDSVATQLERIEAAVPKPAPSAQLVAVSPSGTSAVYRQDDLEGLAVWRVDVPTERTETLVNANAHLREVVLGTWEAVRYTAAGGDTLVAHLLRPTGVPPGVRVPLVVDVYQSRVLSEDALARRSRGEVYVDFLYQIFAAHGLAVLLPSMPYRRPEDGAATWLASVPDGVLPAVDSVLARGIADPERLFVTGHSTGGFSAVSLVAQTTRFKAAAASAGYYNLTSLWGAHQNDKKWIETGPVNTNWQADFLEGTIGRPGLEGPPWQSPLEYVHNSPLFLADRIRTPILLLHGDLDDAVPITQSEELFTALWRQGKRARFVRYWGEHHGLLDRPGNVPDVYYQQLAWFDEFGDIARDAQGNIIWEQRRAKSRAGAPALTVADYARFEATTFGRQRTGASKPTIP